MRLLDLDLGNQKIIHLIHSDQGKVYYNSQMSLVSTAIVSWNFMYIKSLAKTQNFRSYRWILIAQTKTLIKVSILILNLNMENNMNIANQRYQ